MANLCAHIHYCFEETCRKPFVCEFPECVSLHDTVQRVCDKCSYFHGWRQKQDQQSNDWSAL